MGIKYLDIKGRNANNVYQYLKLSFSQVKETEQALSLVNFHMLW